ncbi:MAG: glycosyltransferase family 4 protein [Bacteroidetes bacterium]|nr:glycosyltransferase family 4 protein [Bacteroidota bacterium]
MKVGIDIYSFDGPGQNYGVGPSVYVWHLLPELFKQGNDNHYYVFANNCNCKLVTKYDNVTIIINRLPIKLRIFRILHEQIYLVYQYHKLRLDFIHYFGNNISYLLGEKSLLTVFDLMWKYYLDHGGKALKLLYFRFTVPVSIKKSRAIITISDFIAKEIKNRFNKQENIYPILLAPCDSYYVSSNSKKIYDGKYNYNYIYTVTTSMPHKNLILLLNAFAMIKKFDKYPGKLIISGQLKGNYHKKTISYLKHESLLEHIILTGFISEEEKAYLYSNAEIFIYTSLYEGFGLPVIEAMNYGTPVIAANTASLPEVGGGACIYFNPLSINDLRNKINYLLSDIKKRNELIALGLNHVKNFRWSITAEKTLSTYKKVFESG